MQPGAEVLEDQASTFRIWRRHLLAFSLPLLSFSFLITGPHPWYIALLWFIPLPFIERADREAKPELRQPNKTLPDLPFTAIVVSLALLQFVNIYLLGRMFSTGSLFSADTIMTFILVGSNSGFSGIVVAHELVHRKEKPLQLLGRAILCTVMYEHFYTEHLRGHHARVGTAEDPATARFGERFIDFYRRTVPAQFRSAWKLECKRLGDENMKLSDPRLLRNRVVHGIIVEWSLALTIFIYFGLNALIMFLVQAFRATLLLEVVNYFEHWGLTRTGKRVRPVDSWDTQSSFTLYSLVGLSRHADHHAYASRPYQQLRHWDESPKLPRGYIRMAEYVLLNNRNMMQEMTAELRRRKLGPFEQVEVQS